ncbi:hypothetical protein ZWY2020_015402 [Hordeum vulgare]|nr:hypothetical protein ZWY2020_015402 [Hordeum vulgare]
MSVPSKEADAPSATNPSPHGPEAAGRAGGSSNPESARDAPDWSTVVARNDTHVSTMEGGVDWSQIEIAPMNDDEIDIPITEEKMCSVIGINDEPEHKKHVSEATMKASIANVDASVADIDDDLLADAALPVPDHMPEEDHFWSSPPVSRHLRRSQPTPRLRFFRAPPCLGLVGARAVQCAAARHRFPSWPHRVFANTGSNSGLTPYVVPTISMDELKEITRNFSNDALIGADLYGQMFSGVLRNGHKSMIKKLRPGEEFILEVPVVSRFIHENVLQLHGYCVEGDNYVLAYEYASRGSLHDILHGKKNVGGAEPGLVLSWEQRVKIAMGAATGLQFLHNKAQPCVIHGGIKSSSIFFFDSDIAKIGYPGVSRKTRAHIKNIFLDCPPGCPQTTSFGPDAPEYAMTGQLSTMSDVYSFGVVLLEILTGRKALDFTLPHGQQSIVAWAIPRLDEVKVRKWVDPRLGGDYPPKALTKMAAVARHCVEWEPEHRPNINKVVEALKPLLL